jgi:site-specific DNA recombinase
VDKSTLTGLKINEYQAKIVRTIFNFYMVEKFSIRGIADRLNDMEGYKPARGDHWGKSSIHKILINPAYMGSLYYNKSKCLRGDSQKVKRLPRSKEEWIRIEIPPIIDEHIYEETKRRLEYSRQLVRRETTRDYLLSGFIVCGECGKAYVCEGRKPDPARRMKNEAKHYRHRIKEGHCSNRIISTNKLDDIVWSKIVNFLSDPDTIREGYQQAIDKGHLDHQREIDLLDELTRSDAKLSQRLQNLIKAYTDPDIGMDKDEFLGQKLQIDDERRQVQERIKEIKTYLADLPTPEDLKNLEEFSAAIRDRLQGEDWEPTVENKRWVMKRLNIKVVISEDEVKIKGIFGDFAGLSSTTSTYCDRRQRLLRRRV